jgi:hypothetical protein
MAGLEPAIHVIMFRISPKALVQRSGVDGRDEHGQDASYAAAKFA